MGNSLVLDINRYLTGYPRLNRQLKEQNPQHPVDFRIGVERHHTLRQVREQVKRVVDDLEPVQVERGVHVRRTSRADPLALRRDEPQLPPPVPHRDVERPEVHGEQVPVLDPEGKVEGEVEGKARGSADPDAVEPDPGELDGGVGGEEEERGGGDEEEGCGEDEAAAEAEAEAAVAGVRGEDDNDGGGVGRRRRERSVGNGGGGGVLGGHVWTGDELTGRLSFECFIACEDPDPLT